ESIADVAEVAQTRRDVPDLDVPVQLLRVAAADHVDDVRAVTARDLLVGGHLRQRLAAALALREELVACDDALLEVQDVPGALPEEVRRLQPADLEDQER